MTGNGPLQGIKVVEFAGIGPGPYAGQLLADLGAKVTVVDRPNRGDIALERAIDRRGKRSVVLDLKTKLGHKAALALAAQSDVLIEGNRPGVMERLGLGPETCKTVNSKLVYGRMTGWGQRGPMAKMAGHDINYLSLTGALHAMGDADRPPPPPLNLVGDFGGGSLFLITGILAALLAVQNGAPGRVVDAAIIDGVVSMMGMVHSMDAAGQWVPARGANWLDGARPYYRCYRTRDDRFMAVGCIEPKFFALMLSMLGIDPKAFGNQHQVDLYQRQAAILEAEFVKRPRSEWAALFDGSDACVTPVLTYKEAADHPHLKARGALTRLNGLVHPAVAPRFDPAGPDLNTAMPDDGDSSAMVLAELDFDDKTIRQLTQT